MDKKQRSKSGELIGNILFWWLFLMVFGSITALWIRFFWIGWVLR
jgi:hypothetical protein